MRTSMLPALPETGICGRRCVVRRSRSPRWHDLGCRAQALTEAAVWRNVCVDVAPMPVPRGVEYGGLPDTPEACVDGILAMPQACEASPARPIRSAAAATGRISSGVASRCARRTMRSSEADPMADRRTERQEPRCPVAFHFRRRRGRTASVPKALDPTAASSRRNAGALLQVPSAVLLPDGTLSLSHCCSRSRHWPRARRRSWCDRPTTPIRTVPPARCARRSCR